MTITLGGMETRMAYLRECWRDFDSLTLDQQSALRSFRLELIGNVPSDSKRRRQVIVHLPLPPKECDPNQRPHWRRKAEAVKNYRLLAGQLAWADSAKQLGDDSRPKIRHAQIQLRYFLEPSKGRDPDNLIAWAKSAIDSLSDAGILGGDRRVVYLPPIQEAAVNKTLHDCPRLIIEITEV